MLDLGDDLQIFVEGGGERGRDVTEEKNRRKEDGIVVYPFKKAFELIRKLQNFLHI